MVPRLEPKYWMVGCSLAEMNAITATFPQAHIALCDFHREQAWERWCSRRENNIDKPQVLALLRKIACALTEEDYELPCTTCKRHPTGKIVSSFSSTFLASGCQ